MKMDSEETAPMGPLPPPILTTVDETEELAVGQAGPSTPVAVYLNPNDERERIQEQEELEKAAGLQAGRHYFIINRRWRLEWLQWIGHPGVQSPKMGPAPDPMLPEDVQGLTMKRQRSWTKERPGPIDNHALLDDGRLKKNINEHADYEILSEEVWKLLHSWHQGGPPIKRRAITQPSGEVVVELYGLTLKVYKSTDLAAGPTSMVESQATTVGDFKKRACEELGLDHEKSRIWDYFNKRKYANLEENLEKTLNDCRIYEDNDILVEQQLADGSWPPDETAARASASTGYSYNNSSRWDSSEDVASSGSPLQKGCVGLQNLGNTCFMNSSLQCLGHVPPLREYFNTDAWKESVNTSAYKTAGKLAEAYAELLSKMWGPDTTQVAPRNFKWQIGQFAGQFAGYGQQDSMEFIEYFIDGLKEDVNKVQGRKPFVELKEAEGRTDDIAAAEAKEHYYVRNNSCVDDLFVGFHKSTVECPDKSCGRVSVTFDPFLSVKLSLVGTTEEKTTTFNIYIIPRVCATTEDTSQTIQRHKVSVVKFGNAENLIEAAAKQHGLEPKNCILVEVFSKKIYKFFELSDAVESIRSDDTLALYELNDASEFTLTEDQRWGGTLTAQSSSEKCGMIIYNRQPRSAGSYSYSQAERFIGIPMLACVDQKMTGNELLEVVKQELMKKFGEVSDDSWSLYRTADKWSVQDCSNQVEPGDEPIEMGFRHYLVVDWKEGVEPPQAMMKLSEEASTKTNGSSSSAGRDAGSISLNKCFDMYVQKDQLSAMDTWYCNKCKDQREAFKKMEFWSLPPVLVLQLKRFTYTQYSRDRLDTAVDYPLEGLDLTAYCLHPEGFQQVYDLASVSKHIGGLGGGHYVAYARSSEDGKWYFYNDSSVTEVTAEQVADDKVGAYVLFYLRREIRPASWGSPTA